jgi:hypothetical protein
MNNKTQRRIHKYFFSHYFCFVFFAKITSEGMWQPTIHQMRERKKKHRGKVKEVEKLQYLLNLIIAQKWIENINSDAVLFKNNYLL